MVNNGYSNSYERKVNIKDMVCDVLLHYKALLAGAVIGAIVIGLFGCMQNKKAAIAAAENKTISDMQKEMSADNNINEALLDSIAKRIIDNNKFCDVMNDYLDNSMLMNINSSTVYCSDLRYVINVAGEDVDQCILDESKIRQAYVSNIISNDLQEMIVKSSNGTVDKDYVSELISVNADDRNESIFVVNVKGASEEFVKTCTKCIDQYVSSLQCNVIDDEIVYDVKLLGNKIYQKYTADYAKNRADYRTQIYDKNANNAFLVKELTPEQKQYVDRIVAGETAEASDSLEDSIESDMIDIPSNIEQANDNSAFVISDIKQYLSLLWLFIGIIVGIFVVIFGCVMRYIVSSCAKTIDDIDNIYLMKSYSVNLVEGKKGYLKAISKWRYSHIHELNKNEVVSIISNKVKSMNIHSIAIVGASNDISEIEWLNQIKDVNTDLEIEILPNVLYNPDSIEKFSKAESVVVAEPIGRAVISECINLSDKIKKSGIKVIELLTYC